MTWAERYTLCSDDSTSSLNHQPSDSIFQAAKATIKRYACLLFSRFLHIQLPSSPFPSPPLTTSIFPVSLYLTGFLIDLSVASRDASMDHTAPLQDGPLVERSLPEASAAPTVGDAEAANAVASEPLTDVSAMALTVSFETEAEQQALHALSTGVVTSSIQTPSVISSASPTSPLPTVGAPLPKKFSAVNINKKFLEKNHSPSGLSTLSHTPVLKSGNQICA